MPEEQNGDPNAQGGDGSQESNDDRQAQEELAQAANNSDDNDDGDDSEQQVDPKVKAKLDKANREARNLRARLKEVEPYAKKAKEDEEAQKSEVDKLKDQLQTANMEITRFQVSELRQTAAHKAGLDPKYAKYITSSDEDEAMEQAKELATAMGAREEESAGSNDQQPDFRQGASRGKGPKKQATADDVIRNWAGLS